MKFTQRGDYRFLLKIDKHEILYSRNVKLYTSTVVFRTTMDREQGDASGFYEL